MSDFENHMAWHYPAGMSNGDKMEHERTWDAAYEAGFRAASDKAATLPQRAMFDAGFERGRIAGLEEAAEVVQNGHFETFADIAAAIRERINGQ